MIEGFRHFSFKECKNKYSKFLVFLDYFLLVIDTSILLFFIPGIVLAFFGNFIVVGPMTLILFPVTLVLFGVMFLSEYNRVFKYLGLKVRKHYLSLFVYMLIYSILLSPCCVWGYISEFFGIKRKWK